MNHHMFTSPQVSFSEWIIISQDRITRVYSQNIPVALARLLSRLRARDVRSVCLGPFEQFHLEYRDERRSLKGKLTLVL